MQINVNEEFKFASVWLTKEEAEAQYIIDDLKPTIEEFRKMKYKFVIFHSGSGSLLEVTKDLLRHNRNLAANNS